MELEFNIPHRSEYPLNSAGRFINLWKRIEGLKPKPMGEVAYALLSEDSKPKVPDNQKKRAWFALIPILAHAIDGLYADLNMIDESTRDAFLEGLPGITTKFLPGNYNDQKPVLNAGEIGLLKVASTMIPVDPDLPQDQEDLIKEKIGDLKEEYEQKDLDADLRTILLDLILIAEESIEHYELYGPELLRESFLKMLSTLMEQYLKDNSKKDETWFKKATTLAKTVDQVYAKVMKYKPLLEQAGEQLGGFLEGM